MTQITSAEAYAPATMANVGVGFDILGVALAEPGDRVRVALRPVPGLEIVAISGDDGDLPRQPENNTATVAIQALLEAVGRPDLGLRVWIDKGLPPASGLGSSAASAVAAVVATNALLGEPLCREDLLPACLEGEALVSGYHADNVGPSLLGGIMLITGTTVRRLPAPANLYFSVVTPHVQVHTAEARAVLPGFIPLKTMIRQTGSVARLIDAIYREDIAEMGQAMESDYVIEPARAHLMPHLAEARQVAKSHGAYALVISGAGPTLCAVSAEETVAQQVTQALQEFYDEVGLNTTTQTTGVYRDGARVLHVV